jgi:hypothetical protein
VLFVSTCDEQALVRDGGVVAENTLERAEVLALAVGAATVVDRESLGRVARRGGAGFALEVLEQVRVGLPASEAGLPEGACRIRVVLDVGAKRAQIRWVVRVEVAGAEVEGAVRDVQEV